MNSMLKKLFLTGNYFTIAIRPRRTENILDAPAFAPAFVRLANAARWSADPILAESDGKTWLFYEAVEQNHGHIEVAEVLPDCSLGEPTVILKDTCHYSYPFVFRWEGAWYLIPESSAAKEVRLYKADSFPFRWTLQEVLLRERAVDTTVYVRDGQLYLLTFLTDGKSERVEPQAYQLCLGENGACLQPLQWDAFDPLQTRGAGPVFPENGELYRPVQINQEQRYGDAVRFCRLTSSQTAYSEQPGTELKPTLGWAGGLYTDGAHTYSRSSKYEAIDLRCHDFDLWKLPRRLLRHLRK